MNRSRADLSSQLTMAAVAAVTTWVALLSWRGFAVQPGRYMWPLILLGLIIGGIGAVARWWRLPGPVVFLIQFVVSLMVTSAMLCGSPVPIGQHFHKLVQVFQDSVDSANKYAPPVPIGVPGVHPLLIAGGLGCLLLVDLLACTMRRVPLAGLPLLTIYSVPVSLLGHGLTWWIFGLTSAGFLTLLFLHETDQVARWGRPLGDDPAAADPEAFGVRTGTVRANAGAIGSVVTALAIFVPLLIPTLDVHIFDFGAGTGGDDISIKNPMVDLRRDLQRGDDIPLLDVKTDDPKPGYLRIAVLNRFENDQWSSGDRQVPTGNQAEGEMPPLVGVAKTTTRHEYSYQIKAEPEFRSTWLPTSENVSKIDAPGDWRFDPADMDFLSGDDNLTTARLTWTFTAVKLNYDPDTLARSGSATGLVGKQFLQLPSDMNPIVRNIANDVTRNAPTRYQKAEALQQWFRVGGGFTYDPTVDLGDGSDDLVRFLQSGNGGRRGYCQQFAASMAVMARILGIPARVAVGFLAPDQVPGQPGNFVFSAHDLHAWPELFFPGSGWVPFDPTPADRVPEVPGYTTADVSLNLPNLPSDGASNSIEDPSKGSAVTTPKDNKDTPAIAAPDKGSSVPWGRIGGGAGLVVLLLLAGLAPRTVRRRRRTQRQAGGAEEAWAELRDTALDLRVPWPRDRSPRQTRDALVRHFGAPPDDSTPERPRRGEDTNPDAVQALDRIVGALERLRYARADGTSAGTWSTEIQSCVAALYGGAPRNVRRLAVWWPRSVFARSAPVRVTPVERPAEAAYSGVVDHVG